MQVLLCDQYDQSTRLIEVAQVAEPNQIITPDRTQSKRSRTWILESITEKICGCVERYQILAVFSPPANYPTFSDNSFRQVLLAKRLIEGHSTCSNSNCDN